MNRYPKKDVFLNYPPFCCYSLRICSTVREFWWPHFDIMDTAEWFQHNSALCCHATAVLPKLSHYYTRSFQTVSSYFGNQNWPERLCNRTSYDVFLWSFVKSQDLGRTPNHIHVHGIKMKPQNRKIVKQKPIT